MSTAPRRTKASAIVSDLSELEGYAARLAELDAERLTVMEARDKFIVRARIDGYPWPRLETAGRLSREGTRAAATRANGGVVPEPRQK